MSSKQIRTHEATQETGMPESRRASGQNDAGSGAQCDELARMINELRELQESIKRHQGVDVQALQEENAELRRALADRDRQLAHGAEGHSEDADLDTMEAELNRQRRQLENERAEIREEVEQLRLRNQELDEATRDIVRLE